MRRRSRLSNGIEVRGVALRQLDEGRAAIGTAEPRRSSQHRMNRGNNFSSAELPDGIIGFPIL